MYKTLTISALALSLTTFPLRAEEVIADKPLEVIVHTLEYHVPLKVSFKTDVMKDGKIMGDRKVKKANHTGVITTFTIPGIDLKGAKTITFKATTWYDSPKPNPNQKEATQKRYDALMNMPPRVPCSGIVTSWGPNKPVNIDIDNLGGCVVKN